MDFSAVLVAAGSGSRAGGGLPKAWRPLAGRPLARWSAEAFAQAETLHVESAPRYDSLAVCEEQHGVGNCGSEQDQVSNGGSGSIFMPLLAGYLIGSVLGNAGRGMAAAQPMYNNGRGGFTNATRTSNFNSNSGRGTLNSQQFTRPARTIGQAPMSRAQATSRSGFGSRSGSRAGG